MFPANIEGIIFDLDGTLANSEPLHMKAWLGVLAENGLYFDEHWFEQWIGLSDGVLATSVVKEYDTTASVAVLQEQKRNTYHRLARESSELFPGVEEALQFLYPLLPLAIATSSSNADAEAVFSCTGIDRYFQAVVTSDMVDHLKPAPDCYRLAATSIGLQTSRGLAVEDSPAGVRAANTAGLFTIAVGNSHAAGKLAEANQYFDNTGSALNALKERFA